MVDKNSTDQENPPAVTARQPGPDAADRYQAAVIAAAERDLSNLLAEPRNAVEAARARYGRPGPKNLTQSQRRLRGRPGERLAVIDEHVQLLDLPAILPGDPVPEHDDHPFGFRSMFYYRDGRNIPTQPEAEYFAALSDLEDRRKHRIALTVLYDAGARIRVSTVFYGHDTTLGDAHPPRLWQTMVSLGHGVANDAGEWNWGSENAARHGHGLIVAAIRAARTARHPARRRTPSTAGPWRTGYRR